MVVCLRSRCLKLANELLSMLFYLKWWPQIFTIHCLFSCKSTRKHWNDNVMQPGIQQRNLWASLPKRHVKEKKSAVWIRSLKRMHRSHPFCYGSAYIYGWCKTDASAATERDIKRDKVIWATHTASVCSSPRPNGYLDWCNTRGRVCLGPGSGSSSSPGLRGIL